jgi:hypothetical protein
MPESALTWGEIEIDDETLTEKDIQNAESSGKLPPMKFLGTCESSIPREAKLENYTCHEANLKWRVDELLEIAGVKATDDEKEKYEGRFVFDGVLLGHPKEKDGIRNRRILVAKRCGLISNTSDKIPANAWSDLIIGAQAIITTEKNSYKDKKTGEQKEGSPRVKFDGYESTGTVGPVDTFDDI